MPILEITPKVRAFLDERRYGVVATINDSGAPQMTVMWYALLGQKVMMNTTAGRIKHRNLLRDPRVSVCVVDEERYVTLYGRATLDDNQAQAREDDYRLAIRYDGLEKAEERKPAIALRQRVTIHMDITHVHARGFD